MSSFVYYLNRLYFSLYAILLFFTHLLDAFLELALYRPLYSFPFIRRRLAKFGLTYDTWIKSSNEFFVNPRQGILMFFTNTLVTYVILGMILLFTNIIYIIYGTSVRFFLFNYLELFLTSTLLFSLSLCHIFIWRNDRYIQYFSVFETESRKKRVTWGVGVFLFCVILTVTIIGTFRYAEIKYEYWK